MARIQNDKYYTPIPIYQWLQRQLKLEREVIFDPCCGELHPTYEAFSEDNCVLENDIDQNIRVDGFDASLPLFCRKISYCNWVITNPPYNKDLLPILNNSLQASNKGVAMLLRLSFLEPTKNRREVLTENLWGKSLKAVYPVNPRPQFLSKTSTDNVTVAWFIWGNDNIKLEPFNFCIDWKNKDEQLSY